MRNHLIKAFTLIEILFVISILGILLAIVLPNLNTMRANQILNSTVADVVSAINKASSQSLASLDSSSYGVHFASDSVTLFKGTVYGANDVNIEVVNITSPVTISQINLGGPTDLYFNRLTNTPSVTGNIVVRIDGANLQKTITIDATGRVSSN